MVDFDPPNQNTPAATRLVNNFAKPTIAELKAAISGSGFASRYNADFMMKATRNDLLHVCRLHGITVATTLPGS